MASSAITRSTRLLVRALVLICLCYAILLADTWWARRVVTTGSAVLAERRTVTLFGTQSATVHGPIIYALDGEKLRHGLMPAAHGRVIAWARGQPPPIVVAIHSHGNRDTDLRPASVEPASWRPTITGRGEKFDHYLLVELRHDVERQFALRGSRFLFGHSLGGYYTIDMATRQNSHGFAGLYAFSPTYSHDLSLLRRLSALCDNGSRLYANIGLESARDTRVFDEAERVLADHSHCGGNIRTERHWPVIHQLIMLTGQVKALAEM